MTGLPPRDEWLRRGFVRPFGWLFVALAPFALSGAARAATGCGLGVGLALALVLTTLAVSPWLRTGARPRRTRRQSLALGAAMIATAALVFGALYVRAFGGLVVLASSGIPDAGNHVLHQHLFVSRLPQDYEGFVALYAVVEWLKRIARCDDFTAFAVTTYVAMCAYAVAGLAAAATALERVAGQRRAFAVGLAAAFAWSLAVAALLLPFLHYHHAQGFFPPIFGVLALLALWFADALVRPAALRWAALAALVGVYRFTYGLNLPDLLLACAVLVAADGWRGRSRGVRVAALAAALALLAAAVHGVRLLETVFHKQGPFDPYDRPALVAAEWLVALALAGACVWPASARLVRGSGIARWVRLPVLLAAINAAFLTLVPPPARGADYYYFKTSLHPLLLVMAASVVLVAALAAGLADAERASARTRQALAAAAATAVALAATLVLLGRSFAVYWPTFRERLLGAPPYRLLKPVADRGAWRRIERVLGEHHAQFGGYLTSYYPTFNFMNSSLGYWNGGIDFYWGAPPAERPGYCVFWEGGPSESRLEAVFPQQRTCDRLSRDPRHTCVGYHPTWDPARIRTLCWLCP